MTARNRREVLLATGAVAAAAALAKDVWIGRAFAQKASSVAASEWDYRTTKQLVEALRAKKISALELTDHVIARIEKLDQEINAVVVRDFDRARAAAKAADAALSRGEQRPLLGIPMIVKESFNVAGLPTTWGRTPWENWTKKDGKPISWTPKKDAVAVARLKAAGAIILGKTNVPKDLDDWQSYNDIYGKTKNPWDRHRTPGGSSGGSAAALAAGFGPLSLGSDIAGSLRVPAHYCGVYAHKPTFGLVPQRGEEPPGEPALPVDGDLAVVGPMARSADDLALALDVLAGPDELRAGIAYRLALPAPRHRKLECFRVLVIDEHPLLPTAASVSKALNRLSERLIDKGAKVGRVSPLLPDLADAARLYMRLLYAVETVGWSSKKIDDAEKATSRCLTPEGESLKAERDRGMELSHRDWLEADFERAKFQKQWRKLFREWDVVLCPPIATPALRHDIKTPAEERCIDINGKEHPYLDQSVWPGVATLPGLPATAAPIDRLESPLPIGVQIIGPYLEDLTPITFAALMEREFGGFVPPPGYAS